MKLKLTFIKLTQISLHQTNLIFLIISKLTNIDAINLKNKYRRVVSTIEKTQSWLQNSIKKFTH